MSFKKMGIEEIDNGYVLFGEECVSEFENGGESAETEKTRVFVRTAKEIGKAVVAFFDS